MRQKGTYAHRLVRVLGIFYLKAPVFADAPIQIHLSLLAEGHSRQPHRHLGEGGHPHFVVGGHGIAVPRGPAVGEGIRHLPIFHHGHLDANGPILLCRRLHRLLNGVVAVLGGVGDGAGGLAVKDLRRQRVLPGAEPGEDLGHLPPGHREAGMDCVRHDDPVEPGPYHIAEGLLRVAVDGAGIGVGAQLPAPLRGEAHVLGVPLEHHR